jgi:hypothetical protein
MVSHWLPDEALEMLFTSCLYLYSTVTEVKGLFHKFPFFRVLCVGGGGGGDTAISKQNFRRIYMAFSVLKGLQYTDLSFL